jgi:hypothetical protein
MRYTIFIYTLVLLIIAFLFIGCNTQKRQIRKLGSLALQQPGEFTRLSNLLNPCFPAGTVVKSDTTIIYGKADTTISYVFTPNPNRTGQTIIHDTVTKYVKITIPVTKVIHDTVPDVRGLAAAKAEIQAAKNETLVTQTQYKAAQDTRNKLLWWVIGLGLIIVAYTGFKVYRFFTGGAISGLIKKI